MNVTNLLTFSSDKLIKTQIQSNELNVFVADSLRVIIEEVFMQLASSFIIVLSSRSKPVFNFFLNVLQHLFVGIHGMNIQLVVVDYRRPQRIQGPRLYNLLLIDSFEAFLDIDIASYTKDLNYNEYYHIFLMQYDRLIPHAMQNIFSYCWNNNIINCNLEFQNVSGDLVMYTYFPYGLDGCDNTKPLYVNQFVDNKWLRRPYFLSKLNNFYGCPLVGVLRLSPPFTFVSNHNNRTFKGLEVALVDQISKLLNFTLVLKIIHRDDRTLPIAGGSLNLLNERKAHFAFGYYRQRAVTLDWYTTTADHFQTPMIAVIYTKSLLLSPFEVLLFPFHINTWYAILVCFIATVAVIKCLQWRQPQGISAFSIVTAVFGISVNDATYSRKSIMILITWIWSAFFLRSFYSSLLFLLFSSNSYHSMPLNVYEALNANYQSVMIEFTFRDIQNIPYYNVNNKNQKTVVLADTNELAPLKYLEEHPTEDIIALVAQDFLQYYMETYHKTGLFYTIPEMVMQQQLCFYMAKHSFLINQFDWALMNLKASGLLKHLTVNNLNRKTAKDMGFNEGKQGMMGQDFYGIYITCGVMYTVAVVVFAIEILSRQMSMWSKFFLQKKTMRRRGNSC